MQNPASYEALNNIANHVRSLCGVDKAPKPRKWTIIQSDGVPYVLASEIQDFHFVCCICKEVVDRKKLSDKEWKEFQLDHVKVCKASVFKSQLDDVLLLLGLGHLELNSGRVLLKLLWEPLLVHIATLLGFRTPRAKEVFKAGIDHHRTRQVLSVLLEALTKELLTPYVRDCISKCEEPTVLGYRSWMDSVCNSSYIFYHHITFSYLLSFHLLTEGVRKNNSGRIMAARVQFAPLYYSFRHPKYQYLHLRDLWQRALMPAEVRSFLSANESFSMSGKANGGQGGDFVLEELNRTIKSHLPPVMPTTEVWQRVCRKLRV